MCLTSISPLLVCTHCSFCYCFSSWWGVSLASLSASFRYWKVSATQPCLPQDEPPLFTAYSWKCFTNIFICFSFHYSLEQNQFSVWESYPCFKFSVTFLLATAIILLRIQKNPYLKKDLNRRGNFPDAHTFKDQGKLPPWSKACLLTWYYTHVNDLLSLVIHTVCLCHHFCTGHI